MAEKITRIVRRRRRIQSFPGVDAFPFFRHRLSPARITVFIAVIGLAIVLSVIFWSYGSKVYDGWRETRLLKRAGAMLEKKDFAAANQAARQVLELHQDSLPAFYILAEASEKQNLEETVSWRAQIARLLPNNLDSQLNLASAALRFGQLDLSRKTLKNVPADQRDQTHTPAEGCGRTRTKALPTAARRAAGQHAGRRDRPE